MKKESPSDKIFSNFCDKHAFECQEDGPNADANDEPRPAEFKMLPEENRSVILATTPQGHDISLYADL